MFNLKVLLNFIHSECLRLYKEPFTIYTLLIKILTCDLLICLMKGFDHVLKNI